MFADIMVRSWGIGEIAIAIVVIAAICALVMIALSKFGIAIPEWIKQVIWVVIAAMVIILAIQFVMSL